MKKYMYLTINTICTPKEQCSYILFLLYPYCLLLHSTFNWLPKSSRILAFFAYSFCTAAAYVVLFGNCFKSFGIFGTSPPGTWTKAFSHPKQAWARLNQVSVPISFGVHHHKSLLVTKSSFPWQQVRLAFSIGLFSNFCRIGPPRFVVWNFFW